jgi:hypothetical protein
MMQSFVTATDSHPAAYCARASLRSCRLVTHSCRTTPTPSRSGYGASISIDLPSRGLTGAGKICLFDRCTRFNSCEVCQPDVQPSASQRVKPFASRVSKHERTRSAMNQLQISVQEEEVRDGGHHRYHRESAMDSLVVREGCRCAGTEGSASPSGAQFGALIRLSRA